MKKRLNNTVGHLKRWFFIAKAAIIKFYTKHFPTKNEFSETPFLAILKLLFVVATTIFALFVSIVVLQILYALAMIVVYTSILLIALFVVGFILMAGLGGGSSSSSSEKQYQKDQDDYHGEHGKFF